ncbi:hypothetical protein BKA67DRAFT_541373 [Truncatella angustata]|uniref:Uncharacterized protein n=1 Tax=Truncatella angustata TaxID=152316 RepID=A0A9P8RNH3_9PEZI|nr:uncharacterized protein BKA67DRAFT_541373 [Truncatella angustata]KAH6646406.1 hypothetical protein BKA67DRAFT_541373 [Truncatella angustata]
MKEKEWPRPPKPGLKYDGTEYHPDSWEQILHRLDLRSSHDDWKYWKWLIRNPTEFGDFLELTHYFDECCPPFQEARWRYSWRKLKPPEDPLDEEPEELEVVTPTKCPYGLIFRGFRKEDSLIFKIFLKVTDKSMEYGGSFTIFNFQLTGDNTILKHTNNNNNNNNHNQERLKDQPAYNGLTDKLLHHLQVNNKPTGDRTLQINMKQCLEIEMSRWKGLEWDPLEA